MKVTTAEEMREIDRRASDEYGIPSVALMQAAGEALARGCVEELGGSAGAKRIAVVCGRGNNGGDGFVAARHLVNAGANVTVFLGATPADLKGDAATFFTPLGPMQVPVVEIADEADALPDLSGFDLVVDALLGTGVRGAVRGVAATLIETINAAADGGVPVVAADIPSGVDADTGDVDGAAVRAAQTVTFALPKRGLLMFPGATHAGRLAVADVGIPHPLLEDATLGAELTTQAWMRRALPARVEGRDSNKGTFGSLLVIAGSAGMAGAAALTALSALRAGAGLVQLAVPESLLDVVAVLAPEVITKPLPETPERTHGGPGALDAARELADKADAVALGPGLSRNTGTVQFVQPFVQGLGKPLVVDADGLNILASSPDSVRGRTAPTVFTPHPGEMGRLLDQDTGAVQSDRAAAVRQCADSYNVVALLKGSRTLIAAPENKPLALNRRGSVALATAGSGDVLTGVIGALLAQKLDAFDAARAGAYLHALAGEIAARVLGTAGVVATDVRDRLPHARAALYGEMLHDL